VWSSASLSKSIHLPGSKSGVNWVLPAESDSSQEL
jgi:chromosome segregation ATPase